MTLPVLMSQLQHTPTKVAADKTLAPLASLYLAARQFTHNAHHLTTGPTFFEDHEFMGTLYDTYLTGYDMLVERMLGLKQSVDLIDIADKAAAQVKSWTGKEPSKEPAVLFKAVLKIEEALRAGIDSVYSGTSIGTQNTLAAMADESEVRTYKVTRRLA